MTKGVSGVCECACVVGVVFVGKGSWRIEEFWTFCWGGAVRGLSGFVRGTVCIGAGVVVRVGDGEEVVVVVAVSRGTLEG